MSKKNTAKANAKGKKPNKSQPKAETAPKMPPEAQETTKKADPAKLSGLDAAAKVLADAGAPLNVKEMFERIQAQGLWKTDGKTPHATIYSAIIREIKAKGAQARFKKTERGRFAAA